MASNDLNEFISGAKYIFPFFNFLKYHFGAELHPSEQVHLWTCDGRNYNS